MMRNQQSKDPLAFISYRRDDSEATSLWIAEFLDRNFGDNRVFIDNLNIRAGDKWQERIEENLARATAIIIPIGPNWLRLTDVHNRRRIDVPEDWVRREIEFALKKKIALMPVILNNAGLLDRTALPKSIERLLNTQFLRFRDSTRQEDILQIVNFLVKIGFKQLRTAVNYPASGPKRDTKPLPDKELDALLRGDLKHWSVVNRRVGNSGSHTRKELTREFKFNSFPDVIHYMGTAARHIEKFDHHPCWENLYTTLTVWLTTWDAGHKPTSYDVRLAMYLDRLYGSYVG